MKKLSLMPLALLAFLVFSSCGTTGGKLIRFPFRAGGMSRPTGGPLTFTTSAGWTVTLQTGRIALGPFYFNTSPPPTDAFRGGLVVIEVTKQVILDVLDPALKDVAGGADGETEHSLVCEIGLLPPDGFASASDRQLLSNGIPGCTAFPAPGTCPFGYVAGTATKGATTVPFAGPIAIPPNLVNQLNPLVALQRVNGATAPLSFTEQTQAVEMRVDPRPWFDSVDFSALVGGTQVAGNFTWDTGSSFQSALLGGVQQKNGVYAFAVKP
jgi:hypothetical protein